MQDANAHRTPRFYFALPRLLWWLVGGDARRSEKNGLEANAVGSLLHLVVYAFAFQVLLANRTLSAQLLLLLPLAFLVWLFWLNLIYANSRIIKLLRACGLMRDLPQSRAQGILIGIITTLFALHLLEARGWLAPLGAVWIGAVTLNLIAAVLLALIGAVESSTN
jgi:hypothetical protein